MQVNTGRGNDHNCILLLNTDQTSIVWNYFQVTVWTVKSETAQQQKSEVSTPDWLTLTYLMMQTHCDDSTMLGSHRETIGQPGWNQAPVISAPVGPCLRTGSGIECWESANSPESSKRLPQAWEFPYNNQSTVKVCRSPTISPFWRLSHRFRLAVNAKQTFTLIPWIGYTTQVLYCMWNTIPNTFVL